MVLKLNHFDRIFLKNISIRLRLCFLQKTGFNTKPHRLRIFSKTLFIFLSLCFYQETGFKIIIADWIYFWAIYLFLRVCVLPKTGFKSKPRRQDKFAGGFISSSEFMRLRKKRFWTKHWQRNKFVAKFIYAPEFSRLAKTGFWKAKPLRQNKCFSGFISPYGFRFFAEKPAW